MVLCAYVGEAGEVVWVDDEGTSTFEQVFVRRPPRCRYAIVKMKDTYASIDMFEGILLHYPVAAYAHDKRAEIGIHRHYRTIEAALMATRLLYNIGETLDGKTQAEIDAFIEANQNCPDCKY